MKSELACLAINPAGPSALFYRFEMDPHRPQKKGGRFVVEAQTPVSADEVAIKAYGRRGSRSMFPKESSSTLTTGAPRSTSSRLFHQGVVLPNRHRNGRRPWGQPTIDTSCATRPLPSPTATRRRATLGSTAEAAFAAERPSCSADCMRSWAGS